MTKPISIEININVFNYNALEVKTQLQAIVDSYPIIEPKPPSTKDKFLNFFSTSKSKICGGFQTAKRNVCEFAKSESTKKFLKQTAKVAFIALLGLWGASCIAIGALALAATVTATIVNPACALMLPITVAALGVSLVASKLIFQLAWREIKHFSQPGFACERN